MLDAIDTIRTKLPFLVDLTPEERRSLPKGGDRARGFVTQALTIATQNEDVPPRSFDVDEMRRELPRVVLTCLPSTRRLSCNSKAWAGG